MHAVFHKVGQACGGIRHGDAACGVRGVREHVGFSQQQRETRAQCFNCEVRLGDRRSAACVHQRARIRGLVVVDGAGQRHQDGGPSGDREFGDGGCAGAGNDQVRCGKSLGDVGEECRVLGDAASFGERGCLGGR